MHDAFPTAHQVPYLVSVADPYDYISPHHVWPTRVLTPEQVGRVLGVSGVRDVRVVENSSQRAKAVRVRIAGGWRTFPAQTVQERFDLGSTDFDVHALGLDPIRGRSEYGANVRVTGFVRGLGRARLEEQTASGWHRLRDLHVTPRGTFAVSVKASRSTELRVAYNDVAGTPVSLRVVPRVKVRAVGAKLRALVSPRLPLRVERLTHAHWRPVATSTGSFDGRVRPGSYRVSVPGDAAYAARISLPVSVRVHATGP